MLNVKEIFWSVQGEGPYSGTPAWFIRLAECPLRCFGCDTSFLNGVLMDENDILKTIKVNVNPKQCQLVVITGGEPLAQNLSPLLELLHSGYSYFVQIETSGVTCREENLEMLEHCVIVCSPKTPKIDKKLQPLIDFYKYVGRVSECDDDGLPSALLNGGSPFVYRDKHRLVHAPHTVFLNPLDEGDAVLNQANLVFVAEVCMRNNWRMGVQLHKLANLR